MRAYYDTGTLVPLYVTEVFSDAINAFVENRNEVIPFHLLHRLEIENALRLKVFRTELDANGSKVAFDKIDAYIREGKLVARPVDWVNALENARSIAEQATAHVGCRSLDVFHVAIAVQWQSEVFVTADDRQIKAARSVGLRTVDVRKLPLEYPSGGSSAGVVREERATYVTRKQPSVKSGGRALKKMAR